MKPLQDACRYNIFALSTLRRFKTVDTQFDLEDKKKAWRRLLFGEPLSITVVEQDTIVSGDEVLVYRQTIAATAGHINLQTLEYNEWGDGFPVHLIHKAKEYMEWIRDRYPGHFVSWDSEEAARTNNIRTFLPCVQVPTATVLMPGEL